MYTFLNQKYGLKALIIEHASSIVRAVNKYSDDDNDVCVFGKILRYCGCCPCSRGLDTLTVRALLLGNPCRNEVDEEFRFVQKQLKETVVELLRLYLKGKNPLKTDDAIHDMLVERLKVRHGPYSWCGKRLCPPWVSRVVPCLLGCGRGVCVCLRATYCMRSGWTSSSTCTINLTACS